jgi:hypothetical protein
MIASPFMLESPNAHDQPQLKMARLLRKQKA